MAVSDDYLTFVLDQLRFVVPALRARRMFGSHGLYAGDLFFAVIGDGALYLKVDEETRVDYEARGMPAFQPMEGVASMNYSQLPEELLEEPEALRPWVERAVEVARRAKTKRRTRRVAKTPAAKKSATKTTPATKKAATKKTPKKSTKTPKKPGTSRGDRR